MKAILLIAAFFYISASAQQYAGQSPAIREYAPSPNMEQGCHINTIQEDVSQDRIHTLFMRKAMASGAKLLCDSTITYDANGDYSYKEIYTYESNGNHIIRERYNWRNGTWAKSSKYETAYDDNGNQTLNLNNGNWQNNQWNYGSKTERTYDEKGNMTTNFFYDWKDGQWVASSKEKNVYSYDDNGNQTCQTRFYWRNSYWEESDKFESTYDAVGNLIQYQISRWKDGRWVLDNKSYREYDDYGNQTLFTSYNWKDSQWEKDTKIEYTYDNRGNKIQSVQYYWKDPSNYNVTEACWVGRYKHEYAYDDYNNEILSLSYSWYGDKWELSSFSYKYEYTYDDEYNVISQISYEWENGQWVESSKYEFAYDANGNKTLEARYNWKDNKWIGNGTKYEYDFDEDGNQIYTFEYTWQNEQWSLSSRKLYYYYGITPPDYNTDDALYADNISTTEKDLSLPLLMKNDEVIIGYQCDIMLPTGIEFATNDKGKYLCETSDRCDDHTISAKLQEDGSLRILCMSMSNTPFDGNDGVIANVGLKISDKLEPGAYNIIIKNAILSTENNEKIKLPKYTCTLIVEDYTPGDVNNDGEIDIVDVTSTISCALGDTTTAFNRKAADMNGDGEIDVVDVTLIVAKAM